MAKSETAPIFFATPKEFRNWLARNHMKATEQWVGFYRKASARPSITWPESVDEALCVGWIDGLRKGIDSESYMIRFTPRKPTSNWSAVNIGRIAELEKSGRLQAAGRRVFAARSEAKSGIYAYEQRRNAALDEAAKERFRQNREAWNFFHAQPPSYRRVMAWWVISAKQEATKKRRLEKLIAESHAGRRMR